MKAVRQGEWLTSLVQEISSICGGRSGIPVQGSTLRAVNSLYVFTRLVELVACFTHRLGVRVHQYIDDWLLRAPDRDRSLIITMATMVVGGSGVQSQLQEVRLNPGTGKGFLGIVMDLTQFKAFPSEDRIARCLQWIHLFLMSPSQTALIWQRLIGHLVSLTKIVSLGATMLIPVQRNLAY